jgi:hypothetical protein
MLVGRMAVSIRLQPFFYVLHFDWTTPACKPKEHYFTEKALRDRRSITSFFRRDPFGFPFGLAQG